MFPKIENFNGFGPLLLAPARGSMPTGLCSFKGARGYAPRPLLKVTVRDWLGSVDG